MESFDWGVTLIGEFKILEISGLIFSKMQVIDPSPVNPASE